MKNILLSSIFTLVLLPQMSFGQDQTPAEPSPPAAFSNFGSASCTERLDNESRAFFSRQSNERGVFISGNRALIDKQDRRGKWLMSHKDGRMRPGDTSSAPEDLTAQEQSIFAAFEAKQQSDKNDFLAKLARERKNCS